MRKRRQQKPRAARRPSVPMAPRLTQSQITARDWKHASTEEINDRIRVLGFEVSEHDRSIAKLTAELAEHRKPRTVLKAEIDALEALIQTRQDAEDRLRLGKTGR